jgi:hypothetical protein
MGVEAQGSFVTHECINFLTSFQEEKEETRVTQIKNKEDLERFLMSTDRFIIFFIHYMVANGYTVRPAGFRIRIDLMRIADPDPAFFLIADPDPGFDDLKLKKKI